jgi:hypothetical protein
MATQRVLPTSPAPPIPPSPLSPTKGSGADFQMRDLEVNWSQPEHYRLGKVCHTTHTPSQRPPSANSIQQMNNDGAHIYDRCDMMTAICHRAVKVKYGRVNGSVIWMLP